MEFVARDLPTRRSYPATTRRAAWSYFIATFYDNAVESRTDLHMTVEDAISFIREHGLVLASGKGPVPRLSETIAGGPIKGSWWAHPKSHQIFAIFSRLAQSPEILVCRLVGGKLTFVHRRLWPALVKLAKDFEPARLAQVHQEHTRGGYHIKRDIPFPKWVPAEVMEEAQRLSEQQAREALGALR